MRRTRATRALRGVLAASVATFVALLSHVTAGGEVPGWVGVVVPLALSAVVCTALAGRRLSPWRLAIAVGISQFLFHALFVLGASGPSVAPASSGHHHAAGMSMPAAEATVAVSLAQSDTIMWAWHVAAALVTTVALYRGERVVVRLGALARELASWARRVFATWGDAVLAPVFRRVLSRIDVDALAPTSVFASSVRRRGPPTGRVA